MPTLTKIPVDIERQVFDYVGTGSPATILANAPAGATYRQIDGGVGSMLWQKTTAGWEALAPPGGAPSWASITGKPTTIGGYGITDFNSLGDARWLGIGAAAASVAWANITGKPSTIAGYGITNDIAYLSGGQSFTSRVSFWTANDTTTGYASAGLWIRETGGAGNPANTGSSYAPRLGFHWGGVVASQIGIETSGRISILNNPGTSYERLIAASYDFASGARLIDGGAAAYIDHFSGNTTSGAFRFFTSASGLKGYIFWNVSGFGLLNDQGAYSVLCLQGAGMGGQLTGSWTVTTNLNASGEVRAGAYAGGGHNAGDITARRSATTGVFYFGDYTDRYLYYDGSNFNLPGGALFLTATTSVLGLSSTTGTNACYFQLVNTGGTYYFGVDNSAASSFGFGAYGIGLYTPAGVAWWINKTTNVLTFTQVPFVAVSGVTSRQVGLIVLASVAPTVSDTAPDGTVWYVN
jgi:hypothetical protein